MVAGVGKARGRDAEGWKVCWRTSSCPYSQMRRNIDAIDIIVDSAGSANNAMANILYCEWGKPRPPRTLLGRYRKTDPDYRRRYYDCQNNPRQTNRTCALVVTIQIDRQPSTIVRCNFQIDGIVYVLVGSARFAVY